jgi:hypothetical protein
MKTMMF